MTEHPYKTLSDKSFWRRAVTSRAINEVDPIGNFKLNIDAATKVATAGSCFAQHIARYLQKASFNYYVTEPGHPILDEKVKKKNNYGLFSARYGNIYTTRQLVQLFKRAFGDFSPLEDPWFEDNNSVLDPFRPTVQPDGFISIAEMEVDRKQHLKAVRRLFETLDVFVFTLGLTECWISNADGAVFPVCPGVNGGKFDKSKYTFCNQTVDEVIADLDEFFTLLNDVNLGAKMILTVSPVPLMATAVDGEHVLSATTYSKSVLRVAAETICKRYEGVFYFPSFEIITGNFNRGSYYGSDLRSVTEEGVKHVMTLFMKHAAGLSIDLNDNISKEKPANQFLKASEEIVQVLCDEASLDSE